MPSARSANTAIRNAAASRSASARRFCASWVSATWCCCRTPHPRAMSGSRRSACASSVNVESVERPMARKQQAAEAVSATGQVCGAHILIIEAPYYQEIAKELVDGAIAELEASGASYERVVVPGALEIPLALAQAVKADLIGSDDADARFDGCVVLGCVIRGETTHYETVCDNANHWLMQIAVNNAIPTVNTEAQALERARGGRKGKGAEAVRACLALVALERVFAEDLA